MAAKAGLSEATLKAAAQAMLKVDKYTVTAAQVAGDTIQFTATSKSGAVSLSGSISEPQQEFDLEESPVDDTEEAPGANEVANDDEDEENKH